MDGNRGELEPQTRFVEKSSQKVVVVVQGSLPVQGGGGVNPSPREGGSLSNEYTTLNHLSPEGWWDLYKNIQNSLRETPGNRNWKPEPGTGPDT